MIRIQSVVPAVLGEALAQQPLTPAKLTFCWRLVVGPAVARATRVTLDGTTLRIGVQNDAWRREIERALPDLRARLGPLLGQRWGREVFYRI